MQRLKKIKLTRGKYALVDAEDFIWLSQWKWFFDIRKGDKTGYAFTNGKYVKGKRLPKVRMHNLIMGRGVDHINGSGIDNRRKNLRKADKFQQAYNTGRKKYKKTKGCKGVSITRDRNGVQKYWIARITVNGNRIYLGTFKNHTAASRAYIKAAKKYHGEFARWR